MTKLNRPKVLAVIKAAGLRYVPRDSRYGFGEGFTPLYTYGERMELEYKAPAASPTYEKAMYEANQSARALEQALAKVAAVEKDLQPAGATPAREALLEAMKQLDLDAKAYRTAEANASKLCQKSMLETERALFGKLKGALEAAGFKVELSERNGLGRTYMVAEVTP